MKIHSQGIIAPFTEPPRKQAQVSNLREDTVTIYSFPELSPLNRPQSALVNSQNYSLKTLGGQPAARQALQTLAQALEQNHKGWPVLLCGNSGSGKTTLLRGLAGDLQNANIATVGVEADALNSDNLQAYFSQATQLADQSPHGVSLLALEDLDLAARVRSSEAGEVSTRQHQLLACLCRNLKENPRVVVVATTSRPEIVDREASELFQKIEVKTPSGPEERLEILQSICRQRNIQADPQALQEMAEATRGDQTSQLVELAQKASPQGLITPQSGRQARLEKVFGAAGPVTLDDANFRVTVCHELGHVVVRHLFQQLAERTGHPEHLPQAIDSLSFAPRGGSNAAVFLKNSGNPISSFEYYFAEVSSNLAGRAAENQCGGGQLTAGPADDILNATRLTQEAVRLKGMGQNLGPFNPNNAMSGNTLRLAEEDEDRFTKTADRAAASIVNYYRPMIEDYAEQIVLKRNDPEALCVSGTDLLQRIKDWEHGRREPVEKLQNWVSKEMESLKPKPPAIYDPVSDKLVGY
ncbi:MAG: AAA family ATPase [Candidatus Eremiobacteraeota bacterium]|nr:AAA family ATPase [Candidatus Eremiobacteraeota bacterium]MCW5866649.1 AAA family ATPase [Candidatus Eremiobacteraeota bacterium]